MKPALEKHLLLIFICFIATCFSANAQLNASFVADNTGGCSPFTVHFTNTSSASSNAIYKWDFGNGNSSSLKDPGAVFLEQNTYTVTLTVTDGNQTLSSSQTITVYKKPVIDFSSSLQKVCTPEPTTFTAKATADGGIIAEYLWDFGDGYTQKSYQASVSHSYLTAQEPQVRLSVTDDHGCTNSKTINNLIKVFNGVKADFEADKTFICFQPDPVKMNNKSEGEGPLKYNWDFGDALSSTEKDPTHVFSKKGNYTVSLKIENPNGCKSSLVKTAYLNVGNFKSEINVPDIICKNAQVEIKNASTPTPTSFTILVDGKKIYTDYYGKSYYTFSTAGEHTIQLTNKFGECEETITKKIKANALPQPKGFITEIPDYCTLPVTVNFQDTTTGVVNSEWSLDYYGYPKPFQATGKSVSQSFENYIGNITLFVTDANGCKNSVTQPLTILQPQVYIQDVDYKGYNACLTLTKTFKMITSEKLASFTWNFGDGTSSTETQPEHTFGPGTFNVRLTYTTNKGCTGESSYIVIEVSTKPKADFTSLTPTTVCGNSYSVIQQKKDINTLWNTWIINGSYFGGDAHSNFVHQFTDTGKYTISFIASNNGCEDTMTRVDYITVIPSFPSITQEKNTCDGDRGTVTFIQSSRYANKWIWDFGDGKTATYNTDEPSITHHYTKSGLYKVLLTTGNGQCLNKDSLHFLVSLKEHPVLSSSKTSICADDAFPYTVTNLNHENFNSYSGHYIKNYQYKDETIFFPDYSSNYWINVTPYNGIVRNLQKGKDSLRIILQDGIFLCPDTTNFIPIKITGATAGFEITTNNVCFKLPATFKDTSSAENTTITSRQWNFGDGQTLTTTKAGVVSHTYSNPGDYNVSLAITDASGCTSSTSSVYQMVEVNGPKVSFSTYQTEFHLNTAVQFYNTTNYFNSYNSLYQWDFGDGNTSTEFNPVNTFTKPGNYTIRLIAKNPDTGCGDTAFQKITVKNFNANFSFTSSFVDQIDCSSLLVQFVNTSIDYTHIKWDFGDGFIADNINTPSHVYEKPGKYIVKLFVTGNNGLSKTYIDSLFVRENKINISADMVRTCTAQSVTLSAVSENASSYLWDFGDGTLAQASDTFSAHYYKTPGNYVPKLIAKDADGCASSVVLTNKISIDSLNVSLKSLPKICAPKEVQFNPNITNIGPGEGKEPLLVYHWDFGTGNKKDTANIETPSFTYSAAGNYKVSLKIQSPAGCVKQAEMDILALQGLGGKINGPSDICEQSSAQFTGSTLLPGQPSWKWIFEDGTSATQQNPPAKTYNQPGNFMVKLVVDNNGCVDTVNKLLQVHSKPEITLSSKEATLCEGSSVSITSTGGKVYSWSPSVGLNSSDKATVIASPLNNTNYSVTVKNEFGCINTGSVSIKVTHPFTLQLAKEAEVCSGSSIRLQASGGLSYQWINNTKGLSNLSIPDPVAQPLNSTIYTLIAYGENQCFSDTAQLKVTVKPTPIVHLGNDTTICEGQTVTLKAFNKNSTYSWQDGNSTADYLVKKAGQYFVWVNLNNCKASDTINILQKAIPYFSLGKDSAICTGEEYVLKPNLNTNASFLWQDGSTAPSFVITREGIYKLTATNECGSHSDAITITKGLCNMLMPTGFSPNNDGLNDVFKVKYPFAVSNFHFIVTNRWGQTVFETNDIHKGWDGTFKGAKPLEGLYVWVISFTDINNKSQQIKGTVTLLK